MDIEKLLNPLGFDDFEASMTPEQKEEFERLEREAYELSVAFKKTFDTPTGRKVLKYLRDMTIENATWQASLGMEKGVPHGFAREGQNALVRHIEERIEQADALAQQRKTKGKNNAKSEKGRD